MTPKNKICITFAGAVGSSKTPISNYLSTKLALPIYSNDAVRSEVLEDLGVLDTDEYLKRRNSRLNEIFKSGVSFICDVSVDRQWKDFKEQLELHGYKWFIISIDLSKDFLKKLYEAKAYVESIKRLDKLIEEHERFLQEYVNDVNLHITENTFNVRLKESLEKIETWINTTK
jgi:DNA-binding Lrp family transcriptional regulator